MIGEITGHCVVEARVRAVRCNLTQFHRKLISVGRLSKEADCRYRPSGVVMRAEGLLADRGVGGG